MYQHIFTQDENGIWVDNRVMKRLVDAIVFPLSAGNLDYEQFLVETEGGTININPADPIAPPGIADLAREALHAIDWSAKIALVVAGRTSVDASRVDTDNLRLAANLTEARTRAADALDKHSNVLDGLIDEAEDNLRRWRKLLQAFSMTEDTAP
jgi:hypothetical protein